MAVPDYRSGHLLSCYNFFPLIILSLFITGCGGGGGVIPEYKFPVNHENAITDGNEEVDLSLPKWTLLAYINGDTCDGIEGPSLVPVNELSGVSESDELNVVVQRDMCTGPPSANTQRLLVPGGDKEPELLQDLGELDMGDYQTLIDFIEWGREAYPAQNYILYFFGHGSGWYVSNIYWTEPGSGSRSADSFISDQNNGKYNKSSDIDIHQLRYVLEKTGLHPRAIIFGPCLMGMIEVAYELRDVADVLVASELTTKYLGGNIYKDSVQMIADDPDIDIETLAGAFIQKYVASLNWRGDNELFWATMAAVDLSKISDLADAIGKWGHAMAQNPGTTKALISQVQNFDGRSYLDIKHFASLEDSAEARAVSSALDDAIIAFDKHGSGVENANGLSILLEDYFDGADPVRYKKLQFAQRVPGWTEYLYAISQRD